MATGPSKQKFNLITERKEDKIMVIFTYRSTYCLFTAESPTLLQFFFHILLFSHRTNCIYSSLIFYFLPYAPYITNNHQNLGSMSLYKRGLKRWSITSNYTMFRASGPFIVVLCLLPPPHILMGHSGKVCPASLGDSFIEWWRSINI